MDSEPVSDINSVVNHVAAADNDADDAGADDDDDAQSEGGNMETDSAFAGDVDQDDLQEELAALASKSKVKVAAKPKSKAPAASKSKNSGSSGNSSSSGTGSSKSKKPVSKKRKRSVSSESDSESGSESSESSDSEPAAKKNKKHHNTTKKSQSRSKKASSSSDSDSDSGSESDSDSSDSEPEVKKKPQKTRPVAESTKKKATSKKSASATPVSPSPAAKPVAPVPTPPTKKEAAASKPVATNTRATPSRAAAVAATEAIGNSSASRQKSAPATASTSAAAGAGGGGKKKAASSGSSSRQSTQSRAELDANSKAVAEHWHKNRTTDPSLQYVKTLNLLEGTDSKIHYVGSQAFTRAELCAQDSLPYPKAIDKGGALLLELVEEFCEKGGVEGLTSADFGKLMRALGTRRDNMRAQSAMNGALGGFSVSLTQDPLTGVTSVSGSYQSLSFLQSYSVFDTMRLLAAIQLKGQRVLGPVEERKSLHLRPCFARTIVKNSIEGQEAAAAAASGDQDSKKKRGRKAAHPEYLAYKLEPGTTREEVLKQAGRIKNKATVLDDLKRNLAEVNIEALTSWEMTQYLFALQGVGFEATDFVDTEIPDDTFSFQLPEGDQEEKDESSEEEKEGAGGEVIAPPPAKRQKTGQ